MNLYDGKPGNKEVGFFAHISVLMNKQKSFLSCKRKYSSEYQRYSRFLNDLGKMLTILTDM